MDQITVKIITDKNEWEDFLASREEANFLHSWYWGEFHERLGNKTQRSGFYQKDKLVGVLLTIVESARRGRYIIVPGGPIIDWNNRKLVSNVFSEIRNIAKAEHCSFVRIRPQLIESPDSLRIFKENGCIKAPMHLTADLTHQLNIALSEEELLANMRKATRYEIKKSEKIGIKVTKTKDEKQIKEFYDLQLLTARRQHFVPFSYKFFAEQFKVLFEADRALIFTAKFENKVLAQAFIIFYGQEAVYHYGVSTEDGRKYPGAYALQWEGIKEAKRRGIKKYNFWGVAPEHEKDHRFSGVSLFKRGFGGEDVQYLHANDLIINYPRYVLNFAVEAVRKKVRRV